MEIPMTTAVVCNGSSSGSNGSRSSRVEKILMPDGHQSRVECNGVLSRCRDVAVDVACVFSACRRCNYSRGTSAAAAARTMGGSKPAAKKQTGISSSRRLKGLEEQSRAESDARSRRIRRRSNDDDDAGWRCPRAAAAAAAKPRRRRRQILIHNVLTLLLLTLATCRPCRGHDPELSDTDDEDGPLQHVVSVVKGKTNLPCDVTPPDDEDDQASLVLFYKDGSSQSIYTYDARDKYAQRPRHWSDEHALGKRAFFSKLLLPQQQQTSNRSSAGGGLTIDNVHENDAGLYRCRVDFKRSPTRNSRVNLTVVVPPKQMKITNEKGMEVGDVIGPFDEGATLILVCIVTGGNPMPEVTWWQEGRMIDRHVEVRQYSDQGVASNVLQLERLSRNDLRSKISCHASNSLLAQQPLTKTLEIELNLKPLDVRILSSRQPLSSGKKYELTCQTTGSRPFPKVTWWKNGHLLKHSQETQYDGGNVTLSQLTVQLTPEDDGKKLVCRAENSALGLASSATAIEDTWLLDVYYVPHVRLELGRNLQGDHIREGIDVYFNCHVTARPAGVRLVWKHQSKVLHHNVSAGVIISESSLVLQRVARSATGRYTCHASNAEGEGSSAPFHLNVAHKPVCRAGQKISYGGAKGLTSEVECHVESKPSATSFRWAFNGSGELLDLTPGQRDGGTSKDGSTSILRYTPRNHLDFGTLLCWATNPLGTQSQPCVFHFYAAGVPDPPRNCSISNQTLSSFEIDCAEGYDGGIPQHFKMHVFDIKTRTLLANLTSSSPRFALHLGSGSSSSSSSSVSHWSSLGSSAVASGQGETPKTHSWKASSNNGSSANSVPVDYGGSGNSNKTTRRHSSHHLASVGGTAVIPPVGTLLQVTAVNAHGVSESVLIEATQKAVVGLLPAEMQAGSFSNFQMTSTVGLLIGMATAGVLVAVGLVLTWRFRLCKKKPAVNQTGQPSDVAANDDNKDRDRNSYSGQREEYIELGTKDPDVIAKEAQGMAMISIPHLTQNPLDLMINSQTSSI